MTLDDGQYHDEDQDIGVVGKGKVVTTEINANGMPLPWLFFSCSLAIAYTI